MFYFICFVLFCVVAKSTEEARDILADLFDNVSANDIETMRYMLIEVCVCVFHGFSSMSPDKVTEPSPVELIPKQQTTNEEKQLYRESKLGREPLSVVGVEKVDENFQYDEYSDDSHGDTSYSDSDFGRDEEVVDSHDKHEEQVSNH